MIDTLKNLLEKLDPAALLPDLNTVLGKLGGLVRFLMMVGPVLMLAIGLLYFFLSPKEANYSLGYRTWFGMGSRKAWQFTQKLAGLVWGGLGLILTVVMLIIGTGFRKMEPEPMLWAGVRCLLWEAGLSLAAMLGINITVLVRFDWNGNRRKPAEKDGKDASS